MRLERGPNDGWHSTDACRSGAVVGVAPSAAGECHLTISFGLDDALVIDRVGQFEIMNAGAQPNNFLFHVID